MTLLIWQVTAVACFASAVLCGSVISATGNTDAEGAQKGRITDEDSVTCPAQNSKFPVYIPHPDDCNKFYMCDSGKPYLKECFYGLHFNPKINACDYPENAGCETDDEKNPKGKVTEDDLGPCPAKNSKFPVYIPHPDDCNKFYMCDSGKPYLKECFYGLHFNPKTNACDHPENAGCETGDEKKPESKITNDDLGPCPAINSKFPVYIPHPDDCNKFYICDSGKPHLKTCFHGLHFNPKIKACDYPENAGCETGSEKNPKGRITDDNLGPCPAKNSKYPVYLPHPDDCNKFYICDSGKPHLKTCFHGLHFNPKLKACDYPENAGCETGDEEKPKGRITDEDSGPCPAQNSKFPVYLPHPEYCNKFYICDSGKPHLKTCHPGLHFNAKLKACDYPENAGCETDFNGIRDKRMVNDNIQDTCQTKENGRPAFMAHPTECEKFFICHGGKKFSYTCQSGLHFNPRREGCDYPENAICGESSLVLPEENSLDDYFPISCPAEDSAGNPTFHPHPTDCDKFYVCDQGKPALLRCPLGLNFNDKIKICDFPENTVCENQITLGFAGVQSPFCPSRDGKIPVFFRHLTNCSVYYMCGNGFAYEFVCPARLHFNLRKKVCDYEENSNCRTVNP